MGAGNTKSNLRNAFIHLTISAEHIKLNDASFWNRFWTEDTTTANELFRSITITEIRTLRDGSPENLASLCYKMVEKLHQSTATLCNTCGQQNAVLNSCKLLIRLLPCIFEDNDWRDFFFKNQLITADCDEDKFKLIFPRKSDNERDYTSYLPTSVKLNDKSDTDDQYDQIISENMIDLYDEQLINSKEDDCYSNQQLEQSDRNNEQIIKTNSLARILIKSVSDLLFCPEFTVITQSSSNLVGGHSIDSPPDDLSSLETCDYIWEPGVGYDSYANSTNQFDKNRSELLRLLLTCFSSAIYLDPDLAYKSCNDWLEMFVTKQNRHVLPLFTSLINTICSYKPVKMLPFNHYIFEDTREELVQVALQLMIVVLDNEDTMHNDKIKKADTCLEETQLGTSTNHNGTSDGPDKENLFVEYMSRIHRDEDFVFILKGFTRLLNNPLVQTYLPNSTKRVNFDQELLVLFWKVCNFNRKFMLYVLKTSDILDIVVPILFNLNENIMIPSKSALIHIGVFNLLLLSGERNLGVRLNRPYSAKIDMDIPVFTGTHADLLIIVFHKLILFGQQNIRQLFDFLLTIILNISPYLKTLSMVSSQRLVHLFEIFASPATIYTNPCYHQLVIFLLEIFNNLLQYQFDGNSNLIYSMMKKRQVFYSLANLPTEEAGIKKVLDKLIKKKHKLQQLSAAEKSNSSGQSIEHSEKSAPLIPGGFDPNSSSEAIISSELSRSELAAIAMKDINTSSPLSSANSSRVLQREVSLVATPDISSVTSPIHPNDSTEDSGCCSGKQLDDTSSSSLDDQATISNESPTPTNHRWQPTPEWVKAWKHTLPIHTTLRALRVLAPQIDRLKAEKISKDEQSEVLKFLQNGTLVGLLPVPHPITIRKYHTNNSTTLWFRTCTWGIIYLRSSVWLDTNVRLFKIIRSDDEGSSSR